MDEKTKESLSQIVQLYKEWAVSGSDANEYLKTAAVIASDALNGTKLNCNVGTAEEQIERHHKTYCCEYNSTPTCLMHNDSCALCFARWSQTPYNNDMKGSDDENKY
jgi:hypothetical protein